MAREAEHGIGADSDDSQASALRELRTRLHLSRQHVAAKCHVTVDTVGRWERGDNDPQERHLPLLAEVLGIDVDTLQDLLNSADSSLPLASVVQMPGTAMRTSEPAVDDGLKARVVETFLEGLSNGSTSSDNWMLVAKAVALEVGLKWPSGSGGRL